MLKSLYVCATTAALALSASSGHAMSINIGSVGAMRENIGSVGAMRERDYFQAPQSPFNADAFPCRLELVLFNKTRLAQSCR